MESGTDYLYPQISNQTYNFLRLNNRDSPTVERKSLLPADTGVNERNTNKRMF